MIRLFFIIVLPLALPFVGWFLWKVFMTHPTAGASPEEELPDVETMPAKTLLIVGIVLSVLATGGFLIGQRYYTEKPYQPISVDDFEKKLQQEKQRRRRAQEKQ